MTVRLELTNGMVALIDAADYQNVCDLQWFAKRAVNEANTLFYAHTKRDGWFVSLHRFLMRPPAGLEVDHIDRNGLNCQRANMRLATKSQNNANRSYRNATGFRGVSRDRRRYRAFIAAPRDEARNSIHLGTFDAPEDAARAYDEAALEMWGEFASLNFPRPVS